MKTIKTTQMLVVILLLVSACGKARYEQRWGDPQPVTFHNDVTPTRTLPPITPVVNQPVTTPQRPIETQPPVIVIPKKKSKPKVVVIRDTVKTPECVSPVEGFNCYKSDWVQPVATTAAKLDVLIVVNMNDRAAAEAQISALENSLSRNVDFNIHLVHLNNGELFSFENTKLSGSALKKMFRLDTSLAVVSVGSGNQTLLQKIIALKSGASARTNYSNIRQRLVEPVVENISIASAADLSSVAPRLNSLSQYQPGISTELSAITPGEIDDKTICAIADGREVPAHLNKNTKRIEIGDVGQFNSTVEIFYCQNVRPNLPVTKYVTMRIDNRCQSLRSRFKR
jgi:hypothetical protein